MRRSARYKCSPVPTIHAGIHDNLPLIATTPVIRSTVARITPAAASAGTTRPGSGIIAAARRDGRIHR